MAKFDEEMMLIKPFMPMGGHCLLHGKRGFGKTQMATTLALDVALGLPFLGDYPTTQGTVVYIQADMTAQLQQDRVIRLQNTIALPQPDALPLFFYTASGRFDVHQDYDANEPWVEDVRSKEPVLVVVDTLRKSHSMDENISNTPVEVYAAWREVCGPKPAILYIHHDRKDNEWSAGNKDEAFRGSGAWIDEADLGMHLCKSGGGLYLEWSKLRTCGEHQVAKAINLRMDPDSLLLLADDPVEGYIKDACRRGLPKAQIVSGAMDSSRWGERAMSQPTVYRRLKDYSGKISNSSAEKA